MLQCKKILITKAVHFWLTSVAQKRRVLKLPKVSVPSVSANPAHWSKFALIKIRSRHASIEVFLVGQLEQTREWGKKKTKVKRWRYLTTLLSLHKNDESLVTLLHRTTYDYYVAVAVY